MDSTKRLEACNFNLKPPTKTLKPGNKDIEKWNLISMLPVIVPSSCRIKYMA
jgi:hypothetical protein